MLSYKEAGAPSFSTVDHVLNRTQSYLIRHLLQSDENRMVRRFLLELSPSEQPFVKGLKLDEAGYTSTRDMI